MTTKWIKGTFTPTRPGFARAEPVKGYTIDGVFGVDKTGKVWRGTHLPTGMFVCDARTLDNCKEIVEAFLQVAPAAWWLSLTREQVDSPTGERTDIMMQCAKLRRELKK